MCRKEQLQAKTLFFFAEERGSRWKRNRECERRKKNGLRGECKKDEACSVVDRDRKRALGEEDRLPVDANHFRIQFAYVASAKRGKAIEARPFPSPSRCGQSRDSCSSYSANTASDTHTDNHDCSHVAMSTSKSAACAKRKISFSGDVGASQRQRWLPFGFCNNKGTHTRLTEYTGEQQRFKGFDSPPVA